MNEEISRLKEKFDGEKFTEDNWDELDELDQSEYITGSENCGNSGTYVGYTWYVYTLVDGTEINVYVKPVTE